MKFNTKDAAAGALFILLGLAFGLHNYLALDIGTNTKMGPGYFPLVLACALVILGIAILFHAISTEDEPWGPVPWRGMFFILLGPIVFGATIQGLGLVPALAIICFITSFASYRMSLPLAIVLTAGLVFFCVAIFSWGLGTPIQLFGPWMNVVGLGN
ncbi:MULTISPECIES: tripartite tricarboxylate transporter TctB family protein [Rhodomicrobium]|uniref:tripartite tricarboxylate transporter TctB family protein n=1 Tax=Rhodomicrobium TaxID=1068 RepID=UPI000B4AFF0D|nr:MULTISPECIES: tripartite tricarboxylate transporter TctB family protein [Rhodomicrobium]